MDFATSPPLLAPLAVCLCVASSLACTAQDDTISERERVVPGTSSQVITVTPSTFSTVTIDATDIVIDVDGPGSNVDMMAFWSPPNPLDALMFVTSKDSNLVEIWRYPFMSSDGLAPLEGSCISNGTNGVLVDHERAKLYVTIRFEPKVCVFDLPDLSFAREITTSGTSGDSEPNLGLLELASGGQHLYVTYDKVVFIHDANTGEGVGRFRPLKGLETVTGDEFYQRLYIPDESDMTGVYSYAPDGTLLARFGANVFRADAEGILLYTCPSDGGTDNGSGFIVVADQTDPLTDFEFFDRETLDHLGTVRIEGVNHTDGIGSTQQASPAYPLGVFATVDDDTRTVGVPWTTIFQRTGLSCGGS